MLLSIALAWAASPAPTTAPLDLAELTRSVLAVNPEATVAAATLDRTRALADGAAPWPDPMVDLSLAPLTLADMPGWQVEARQDLPLWGARRAARGMATADADAAEARLEMMRLDLAEMATMTWIEWYLVHRELDLVTATADLLAEVRASILSRLAVGRATQLDALQAEAEVGWLSTRARSLLAERDVVAFRLNTLLHRDPGASVAPPPPALSRPPAPIAGGTRPELAETAAMTGAAEAQARMARVDRLPMLGVMAGWDQMEEMPEDRLMVGLSVSVPLDRGARSATVRAADAGVVVAKAEEARAQDAVALAAAVAERRYGGQVETLDALEAAVLPVAAARVAAARDGFAAGNIDVRPLLDAERAALDAAIRHEEALATLVLRAREVELARGVALPDGAP